MAWVGSCGCGEGCGSLTFILLTPLSSYKTMLYSLKAAKKIIRVTYKERNKKKKNNKIKYCDNNNLLETMDPLPSLTSLSTNINHSEITSSVFKSCFDNSTCSCTSEKDIF